MRRVALCCTFAATVSLSAAAQERRAAPAHEHGHGTVNLAIEAKSVLIELRTPGADIVGFEHAPQTAEQIAAVDKAKATLARPLILFELPAAAVCRVASAKVALVGEGASAASAHTEFHAEYTLACDRTDAIRSLGFPYFRLFPGARELDVRVITERGQRAYEVARDSPAVVLTR